MKPLHGYDYVEQLGNGHFGEVFLATEVLTSETRAIKHIDASLLPSTTEAWQTEAEAMAKCDNKHLVKIHNASPSADGPILVMEYLAGGTAEDRWPGGAPIRDGLILLGQICWGVQHIHSNGLVHRDIKPGNILFRANGDGVLGDFGLAGGGTIAMVPAVYLPHTPPEVVAGGDWTPAADVFALGVTGLRILCGDKYLGYGSPNFVDAVNAGAWPDRDRFPRHVHKRLRTVLRKATHPDPAKRQSSASKLRSELSKALPLVSLQQIDDRAWLGVRGTTLWRLTITPTNGGWLHTLERDLSKGYREIRAARAVDRTESEALARATTTLEQLASEG